ncbi:hypothetical protein L1887_09071 [Cichorium endivia]|nr:hypothetical protein L1887_09071 [Cichorium endivia]
MDLTRCLRNLEPNQPRLTNDVFTTGNATVDVVPDGVTVAPQTIPSVLPFIYTAVLQMSSNDTRSKHQWIIQSPVFHGQPMNQRRQGAAGDEWFLNTQNMDVGFWRVLDGIRDQRRNRRVADNDELSAMSHFGDVLVEVLLEINTFRGATLGDGTGSQSPEIIVVIEAGIDRI